MLSHCSGENRRPWMSLQLVVGGGESKEMIEMGKHIKTRSRPA
jgi:hypothetical protein